MSEENKFEDPIHEQLAKDVLEEKRKKEILNKELLVRGRKVETALKRIEEGDRNAEIAKNSHYGSLSDDEIKKLQQDNTEYIMAARGGMSFVNKKLFGRAIPFFRKNLILVAGKPGEGKSTTVANIIVELIQTKRNKDTDRLKRVLVISNEEVAPDVYNRVVCLLKGWHYTNHDKLTDEQLKIFNEYIEKLSRLQMLTVIDNNHNGIRDTTTSVEGICQIFNNLIANKDYYDAVIIDYFQKVKTSRQNPDWVPWQAQEALVDALDQYKNIYPAPIVVMTQVQPSGNDGDSAFEFRLKGRKSILDAATCAVEMVAKRKDLMTLWVVHKSRFNEMAGETVTTGYFKGRYVDPHDPEYQKWAGDTKSRRETEAHDRAVGMPIVSEEEEEKKNE